MPIHKVKEGHKRYIGRGKWLRPGDPFVHPHLEVTGA